jgi:S-adenosylmethionine uptake transporter
MLTAMFVFSANNALAKYLAALCPVAQLLFIRSLGSILVIAPNAHVYGWRAVLRVPRVWLHVLRCVLIVVELGLFYTAVWQIPLADMQTINQATPIIVTALAVPILGEQVGWRRWLAVLVGFTGVLLVVNPSGAGVAVAYLCALAGSVVYSGVILLTRLLRDSGPVPMIVWHVGGTLLASAAVAPFVWQPISLLTAALMALMGIVSTGGHVLSNRALALTPASVVMPFHYTQIVWGTVFGWLFFHDVPSPQMLAGAALIVAAGLFIMHRERIRAGACR